MRSRTILYTGKGGVGKTSVATCTARACAAGGLRTLVISTDPAHSLSESLAVELGPEPSAAGENLWGQQVSAQEEMERHWSGVQDWLGELFLERGLDRISAEELTVPPGMDELFSLLRLQAAHECGEWEVIVVDCAPTGETLRLLSFPDVARWWIEKVFPLERQILAAAGPVVRSLLDIPLPSHAVFADMRRLSENLIAMNEILRDREHSTVRLVMNPDKMVIGEAMRTFTYLNLYGYLTDAVIVNRDLPGRGRGLLRGLAQGAGGAPRAGPLGVRPGPGAPRPVLRPGGARSGDARPARGRAVRPCRARSGGGAVRLAHAGAGGRRATGRGSGSHCRSRASPTSSSRRSGWSWSSPSTARNARSCSRTRSPASTQRRRGWRRASSR